MSPDNVWNLDLDLFFGSRQELCWRYEETAFGLSQVENGVFGSFTLLGDDQSRCTQLNHLVSTTCCNNVGGWFGNLLVFAHTDSLPGRHSRIDHNRALRPITLIDKDTIVFAFRWHVSCLYDGYH